MFKYEKHYINEKKKSINNEPVNVNTCPTCGGVDMVYPKKYTISSKINKTFIAHKKFTECVTHFKLMIKIMQEDIQDLRNKINDVNFNL